MAKRKVHYTNTRLYVNAGMEFPECYVNNGPLDLDKSYLPKSGDIKQVTCKHCIKRKIKRG